MAQSAEEALAFGSVYEAWNESRADQSALILIITSLTFAKVEDGAEDCADGETAAQIFEYAAWARLPMVLHSL